MNCVYVVKQRRRQDYLSDQSYTVKYIEHFRKFKEWKLSARDIHRTISSYPNEIVHTFNKNILHSMWPYLHCKVQQGDKGAIADQ